jgi:hypothetical protein
MLTKGETMSQHMNQILDPGPSPRGWHRLQSMLECPQKYAWQYELGVSTFNEESPALIKGTMMHLALAQYYARKKNARLGLPIDEYMEAKEALHAKAKVEVGWTEHLDQICDCYDQYLDFWGQEDWTVEEVEKLGFCKIGNHLFTGRFDLIIKDKSGTVYVMDHKTTSRIQANQAQYYGISGQLIGYAYMAQAIYGSSFGGVILNQIQHTGKMKFKRINLPPAPNLIAEFPQIVMDTEKRISEIQKEDRDPTKWPKAINELTCYSRYGACPFIDQCKWGTNPIENNENIEI